MFLKQVTSPPPILLLLGVPAFYFMLCIIGCAFAGDGSGSDYFGAVILAPFSALSEGWVSLLGVGQWVLLGACLAGRKEQPLRRIAGGILLIHYVGIFVMSRQRDDWSYIDKTIHSLYPTIRTWVVVYGVSQLYMWVLILWKNGPDKIPQNAKPD